MRGVNVFDPSAVQRLADGSGARKGPALLPPPAPTPDREEHPYVGSLLWRGLTLLIETAEGEDRSGPGWRVTMPAHYGEVAGTISALDGDPVDVFVGPNLDAPMAFVVHQKHPGTQAIDEDKIIIGVANATEAEALYRSAYTAGGFFHGLTAWPAEELANLLRAGGTVPRLDRPSAVEQRLAKAQGETVLVLVDGKQQAGRVTGVGGMGLTVEVGGKSIKAAHGTYQWPQVGEELGEDDDSSESSVSTSASVSAATWGEGLDYADREWKRPPGWATMDTGDRVAAAADWQAVQAEMAARYPIEIEPGFSMASQAARFFAEATTAGWIDQVNADRAVRTINELARALHQVQLAPITAAVILADAAQKVLHQEVEALRARQADRGARHIHAGMMHLGAILDAMEVLPEQKAAAFMTWISHDLAYTLPAARAGDLPDALHPAASALLWTRQTTASWAMREAATALLGDAWIAPSAWIEGHARTDIEAGDPVASAFRMEGATHLWVTKAMEDVADATTAREAIARLRFCGPGAPQYAPRLARKLAGAAREMKTSWPQAAAADAWACTESDGWVQPEPGGLQGHLVGLDWNPATRTLTARVGDCPTRTALDVVFGADGPTQQARKVFGAKATLSNDRLEVGGEDMRLVVLSTGDSYEPTPAQQRFVRALEVAEEQWTAIEAIPDRSVKTLATYGYASLES